MKTLYSLALFAGILTGCVAEMTTDDPDPTSDPTQVEDVSARKTTCAPEACIIGYTWDATSCQCVAPKNQTCGPALTCHGNDHCCAPSSTDPTRDTYYCASASEVCQ